MTPHSIVSVWWTLVSDMLANTLAEFSLAATVETCNRVAAIHQVDFVVTVLIDHS